MAGKLRAQFETVHTALKRALHPDHELCFSLMLVLINCCSGEQDYRAKTEYARQVIAMADAVHPKLFLPLANYQEALAQSLQQHMDQV
jgi:3-deoxy-D-arabino-heptulosonate 7-phosphate (DAHP) synthase